MGGRAPRPFLFFSFAAAVSLVGGTRAGVSQIAVSSGSRVVTASGSQAVDSGYRVDMRAASRVPSGAPGLDALTHEYVPDEVIVKFSEGTVPSSVQQRAVAALGAQAVEYPSFTDVAVLKLEPGADPEVVAQELSARPDVEYAQASYLRQPLFVPNDPLFAQQWNLSAINMERAWDITRTESRELAESVIVAVIDSGLAFEDATIEFDAEAFQLWSLQPGDSLSYPALGRITVPFAVAPELDGPDRFLAPFDFVWMDEHPVDLAGHGTHVTGTLGQLTDNSLGVAGVAFNVRIMPLKVLADVWDLIFGATPVCCGATDADVVAAIRYAALSGAKVINMSLGGPEPSPAIADAIRFAVDRGVFVAIAGGNSFEQGNPQIWPAAAADSIDGAMSVGAVDRQSRRAFYSNTGSYVEITAPGGEQRVEGSTGGVLQQTLDWDFAQTYEAPPALYSPPRFDVFSFAYSQGTSMASPHVAGLAALLISQGVTNPAAVEAAIKQFATDLGEPGRDNEYGYGLINAPDTLRGLGLAR